MTTDQIHYFLTVAMCLNFTEASKKLFVAQSSLSRNIANLEEELGLKLFTRNKKYVRLTPAGAVLFEEFSKLENQISEAIENARQAQTGENINLRIGVVEAQESEHFLPSAISHLKSLYPTMNIELSRGNFKTLRESLKNGQIDIAITLNFDLPSYEEQEVLYENIYHSTGECIISKHHPLAYKENFRLTDLKDETAIAISPDISLGGYNNLIDYCKRHGFTPRHIKTASSVEDIMLMVEAGMGFTVLDENCKVRQNPSVRCIQPADDIGLYALAVWKKSNFNPAIPLFVNTLTLSVN
ncbi:MAG: LysR family transcriptional regulator [Clostridiales bacterium]|nr:LysR family transcriptional regulator [Clostridiales bacterium]MDY3746672.1 LysR family transcriptional regulator [Lachnospiraceae bacterium]